MTEFEWLSCHDCVLMLQWLGSAGRGDHLRRFGIECCRHIWPLLQDERSRVAIETAERFVAGTASAKELAAACDDAEMAYEEFNIRATDPNNLNPTPDRIAMYAAYAPHMLTWPTFDNALAIEVVYCADAAVRLTGNNEGERIFQAELLRQHVPYRHVDSVA